MTRINVDMLSISVHMTDNHHGRSKMKCHQLGLTLFAIVQINIFLFEFCFILSHTMKFKMIWGDRTKMCVFPLPFTKRNTFFYCVGCITVFHAMSSYHYIILRSYPQITNISRNFKRIYYVIFNVKNVIIIIIIIFHYFIADLLVQKWSSSPSKCRQKSILLTHFGNWNKIRKMQATNQSILWQRSNDWRWFTKILSV